MLRVMTSIWSENDDRTRENDVPTLRYDGPTGWQREFVVGTNLAFHLLWNGIVRETMRRMIELIGGKRRCERKKNQRDEPGRTDLRQRMVTQPSEARSSPSVHAATFSKIRARRSPKMAAYLACPCLLDNTVKTFVFHRF